MNSTRKVYEVRVTPEEFDSISKFVLNAPHPQEATPEEIDAMHWKSLQCLNAAVGLWPAHMPHEHEPVNYKMVVVRPPHLVHELQRFKLLGMQEES